MADKKDIKRFKCINFGACAKADSGEVIEIDAVETLGGIPECPHCHQHTLEEIVKKPFPTKLVAGVVAGILVLGGIGFGVTSMLGGGSDGKTDGEVTPTDTAIVQNDTIETGNKAKEKVKTTEQQEQKAEKEITKKESDDKGPETTPKPEPTTYNMGWGTYDGPMSGGVPHGFGGSITVRGSHTIDLKKASGETVQVSRGDVIMNVKMENGRLRQGEIHFADGTRKFISGL